MTNLTFYNKAQKINWIKILMENKETIPFDYIGTFLNVKLEHYLKSSIDPETIPYNLPTFYKEVLNAWFQLKNKPTHSEDIQRELIWNNKYIKVNNKSLFNKKLYNQGMIFINDILDNTGKLLTYARLIIKYGKLITEYDYMCLKDSIPREWRNMLAQNYRVGINPVEETVFLALTNSIPKPVTLIKSKQIYWILNTNVITTPNCKHSWFDKYLVDYTENQWRKIFTLARNLTHDTKLIEFQFKIIHRVYATDSYVSNFDNSVSKICLQCDCVNNIAHFFVNCKRVNQFWVLFKNWMSLIEGKIININTLDIIFGIHSYLAFRINFCILHAKWWIHLCRELERNTNFGHFLCYLKKIICIEKLIAINRKELVVFEKYFAVIARTLENV